MRILMSGFLDTVSFSLTKIKRQETAALLSPHYFPKLYWEHITKDFVT